MRQETARHLSRKWSGTYLGSLAPSVILLIKITSVNFFVFGGKLVHSLAIIRHLKIPRFSRTGTASAILNSLNDDVSASFP